MKEVWKDIEEWEGIFQVSNLGRVREIKSVVTKRDGTVVVNDFFVRKLSKNRKGYLFITLKKKGRKAKTYRVHRLVALAFIPNPNNLPQINHKDENKTNNCVNNLEWCTNEYNHKYGTIGQRTIETNKKNHGGRLALEKPVYQFTLKGKFVKKFYTAREAAAEYGLHDFNIKYCCQGKGRQHNGYIWCYEDGIEEAKRGVVLKKYAQYSMDGKLVKVWDKHSDIVRKLGTSARNIYKCINGKRKHCLGYKWDFYYE